ncbi:MAG: U32 family peptidase, partial [Firmicutes bacterium]|nr:U32 family peptidase [Bacillota bacterium]
FPGLELHAGCFANVYTHLGALELAHCGVTRITPNFELSLDEIDYLREATGLEVTLWLHGKTPLGITRDCFLLAHGECPAVCREGFWLRHRDWVLKCIGTVVLSGQDLCMAEHLGDLLARGYRTFCIGTLGEGPAYRREVGRIYREALERLAAGGTGVSGLPERLAAHSPHGFCNGYYFGRSGREYVGAAARG